MQLSMDSYKNDIESRISLLIKSNRKKLAISQNELADGICSQPMISSIERGDYLPNAALFMQLCVRLNISLDDSFLKSELKIGSDSLASEIFAFCKKHKYAEMISYMDQDSVIDQLKSDKDYQTYYYYYGCGVYQLYQDALSAKRYLKMAASYTLRDHSQIPKNEIELLLVNALGVVEAKIGNKESAYKYFELAHQNSSVIQSKSENLNVIDYQYGYALFLDDRFMEALNILLSGFDRVMHIESYFMLPEYALLIMNCYEKLGNESEANRYKAKFEVFRYLP